MGEYHEMLRLVLIHVCNHLVQPSLRTFLVAKGHAALAALQMVGPQAIDGGYIHDAVAIVTQILAVNVAAIGSGDYGGALVLDVEDDGLANRR